MKIHSLYYHNPTPSQLEKMIRYHAKKGYRFISMAEFREIYLVRKKINEKVCLITLDDGWQGNLELLPLLEKYQCPICVFVATEPCVSGNYWWEYVRHNTSESELQTFKNLPYKQFYKKLEQYKKITSISRSAMTTDELKAFAKHPLVTIQSHTVNHPILTNSPDDVLDMELKESKRILEEICGYEMYAFSYPNGSLTEREVNAVSKYYDLAFTIVSKHISLDNNRYLLPRMDLTGQFWRDWLKINGLWPFKLVKLLRGY